jgi:hypothetical protein
MNLTSPTTTAPTSDGAADPPEPRPAVPHRRPWHKAFLQLLRRVHLYAGLLMLPWAILYGVTAFLFNHPTVFADRPKIALGRAELQDTPLADLPSSAEVAGQAVAAINAQGKGSYRLVQPEKARFERGALVATVRAADDQQYTVVLEPSGASGSVLPRPGPEKGEAHSPAPFAARSGITLEKPVADRLRQGLPAVLAKVGITDVSVTDVQVSPVSFLMEGDGQLWRVTYNAQVGSVAGKSADNGLAGAELSTRNFLLRLHLAHGYPSEVNVRWLWAVLVDVMAGVMVFWGCSGLLMWWQIKATRGLGLAVLVLSVVAAAWVGLAMHDVFVAR